MHRKQLDKLPADDASVERRAEFVAGKQRKQRKLGFGALTITGAFFVIPAATGAWMFSDNVRDKVNDFIHGEEVAGLAELDAAICNPTKEQAMEIMFDADGEVAWMADRIDGEKVAYIDRFEDGDRLPKATTKNAVAAPTICETTDSEGVTTARAKAEKLKITVNQDDLEIGVSGYNSSPENKTLVQAVSIVDRERLDKKSTERLRKLQADDKSVEKVITEFNNQSAYEVINDDNVKSDVVDAYQDFVRESLIRQANKIAPEYTSVEVSFKGSMDVAEPKDLISEVVIPEDTLTVERSDKHDKASKLFFGVEAKSE